MKFQLLIKTVMSKNKDFSCFRTRRCCNYHANERLNANNCRHFNIYENDNFHALWSMKSFITLGGGGGGGWQDPNTYKKLVNKFSVMSGYFPGFE